MPRHADPHRRAAILAAARAAFLAEGYADVRVTAIAARAGIAAGTLYLYFASKDAIALALVDDVVARLGEHLAPYLAHVDTPAGITALVHEALAFASREQSLMRLLPADILLRKASAPPVAPSPARRRLYEALSRALAEGMRRGAIRLYDPAVLAEVVAGLVTWAIEACFQRDEGDPARYEPTVARFLQMALLPPHEEG
jgi:AcrR family transcriptional regulator